MGFKFLFLVMSFTGLVSGAEECPTSLRQLKTTELHGLSLCQVYERYQTAIQRLEARHISPAERIGNLLAPRFINLPDWLSKRKAGTRAPWAIYDPAPHLAPVGKRLSVCGR